eukprot:199637-Prymnesium_polylepis.1
MEQQQSGLGAVTHCDRGVGSEGWSREETLTEGKQRSTSHFGECAALRMRFGPHMVCRVPPQDTFNGWPSSEQELASPQLVVVASPAEFRALCTTHHNLAVTVEDAERFSETAKQPCLRMAKSATGFWYVCQHEGRHRALWVEQRGYAYMTDFKEFVGQGGVLYDDNGTAASVTAGGARAFMTRHQQFGHKLTVSNSPVEVAAPAPVPVELAPLVGVVEADVAAAASPTVTATTATAKTATAKRTTKTISGVGRRRISSMFPRRSLTVDVRHSVQVAVRPFVPSFISEAAEVTLVDRLLDELVPGGAKRERKKYIHDADRMRRALWLTRGDENKAFSAVSVVNRSGKLKSREKTSIAKLCGAVVVLLIAEPDIFGIAAAKANELRAAVQRAETASEEAAGDDGDDAFVSLGAPST